MRVWLAFALAPLATGVALFLLSTLASRVEEGWWALGLSSLVAYPLVLIIGAPTYALFRKLGWNGLTEYILGGVVLAIFPVALLLVWPEFTGLQASRSVELHPANFWQALVLLIATLITVAVFWLIARPDKL